MPQDTTPTKVVTPSKSQTSGPPESPWQASLPDEVTGRPFEFNGESSLWGIPAQISSRLIQRFWSKK